MASYTIRVVDQAMELVKRVAEEPDLTAALLAARCGLTRTLAFRILATLEGQGLVSKDPTTKTYRLGRDALFIGGQARDQSPLLRAADPILDEFAAATRETISLVIRDGLNAVYLAVRESPQPARLFAQMGRRGPLHAGASGKVLLAFAPQEVQDSVLASHLTTFTPGTITDPAELVRVLAEIRAVGLSQRYGDLDNHSFGFGAPVRDRTGVVAALTVAGPAARLTPARSVELCDMLRSYAERLSRNLGALPTVG